MRRNEIEMTKGPILGKLFLFAIPLMASGMLQLLYNAADLVVVGRYAENGKAALAAVGATAALINLIINVFMGLSVGTSVVVARCLGAKDDEGAQKATHTSVSVALISGLIVGVVGFFASKQFLIWMITPDSLLEMSTIYMKIYFIGAPMNMLYNFGSAVLRASGDTKRPFYFLMISGLINLILNLFFVIVLKMNVAGVALATLASQIVSAVLVTVCLIKLDGPCRLYISKLKVHMKEFRDIVVIGLPAGIQTALFSISNVIIQSSINSFNNDSIMSGYTAASNIEGFVNMVENAFYQAAITFTGQNYGARQYKRTRKVCWLCVALVSVMTLLLSLLIYFAGESLLGIYLPGEEEAIYYGLMRTMYVTLPHVLLGIANVFVGQLRGLGHSWASMIISIFGICGIRIIWIYTVFEHCRTIESLFLSYPVSWLITLVAMVVCYLIVSRKLPKDGELPIK